MESLGPTEAIVKPEDLNKLSTVKSKQSEKNSKEDEDEDMDEEEEGEMSSEEEEEADKEEEAMDEEKEEEDEVYRQHWHFRKYLPPFSLGSTLKGKKLFPFFPLRVALIF